MFAKVESVSADATALAKALQYCYAKTGNLYFAELASIAREKADKSWCARVKLETEAGHHTPRLAAQR